MNSISFSSGNSNTNLIKFLQEYRTLECNGCKTLFGFQSRTSGLYYCIGGCHECVEESPAALRSTKASVVSPIAPNVPNVGACSTTSMKMPFAGAKRDAVPNLANLAQFEHKINLTSTDVTDASHSAVVNSMSKPNAAVEVIRPNSTTGLKAFEAKPIGFPGSNSTSPILWSQCAYSPNLTGDVAVKVNFVWDPATYLVVAANDEEDLVVYQEQIQKSGHTGKVIQRQLITDEMVIAPYEKDYYRARVISVQEKTCELVFVDYGDKVTCPLSSVKELETSLAKHPIYGLTVHLDKVPTPPKGFTLSPEMEDEIYGNHYIIDFCRKEKIIPDEQTQVEVRLWDDKREQTLNEIIREKIAPVGKKIPQASSPAQANLTPTVPPPSHPSAALWTQCRYSENLKTGVNVRVQFQWSPGIYQVVADDDADSLSKFQEMLMTYATNRTLDRPPVINQTVIASYEGELYRGRITKVEGPTCEVFFVDFGDKILCPWSSVIAVDAPLMQYPIYGLTVRLHKVLPVPAGFRCPEALVVMLDTQSLALELVDTTAPQMGVEVFEALLWAGTDSVNDKLRAAIKMASSIWTDINPEDEAEIEHLSATSSYFRETKTIVEETMRKPGMVEQQPYVFRLDNADYPYRSRDLPLPHLPQLKDVLEVEITKFRSISRIVAVPVGDQFDETQRKISENIYYWMYSRIREGLSQKFSPAIDGLCIVNWPSWSETVDKMQVCCGPDWVKDMQLSEKVVIDISRRSYEKHSGKWFRAICKGWHSAPTVHEGGYQKQPSVYEMFLVDVGKTALIPKDHVYAIPHRFLLQAPLALVMCVQLDGITQFSDAVDEKWKFLLLPGMKIKVKIHWMFDEISIVKLVEPSESQLSNHFSLPNVQLAIRRWIDRIKSHKRHLKVKKMSHLKGSYPKNMQAVLAKEAEELKLKESKSEYFKIGMVHPDRVVEFALPPSAATKLS